MRVRRRVQRGAIANDQAGRHRSLRFLVFGVAARVADVRIGQGHQLAGIGRVGENLLVPGHGRIENDLTDSSANRRAVRADAAAEEHAAVL